MEREAKSSALFEKAKKLMPGGVNSPVRAFEPYPFFISRAQGSRLYSVDGNAYIDYCLAYGPLILGHAHPEVVEAVHEQLERGTLYGAPTEAEMELAELLVEHVPCAELVRLVNTGTEATMHAIRLARGYTGKPKVVKFEGCYHGAHDCVLAKAGSGAATMGIPTSLGIPEDATRNTIVLSFNNLSALEEVLDEEADKIAAVVMEPVIGNSGVIVPEEGYLQKVRTLTAEEDVLLVFDEVITGFRLALGGAQERYKIVPDLATLGKILGGGFPMAALVGRKDIMSLLAPSGKVYQAGTFSGNPISVTAGLTTLRILKEGKEGIYKGLEMAGEKIRKGLADAIEDAGVEAQVNVVASMFQVFFTGEKVVDYETARSSDLKKFARYHRELLKRGIFVPPSQFEACFLSTAHSEEDLDKTLEAAETAIKASKG